MPHGPGPFLLDPNTPPFPSGQDGPGPDDDPEGGGFSTVQEYTDAMAATEFIQIGGYNYTGIEGSEVELGNFYTFALNNGLSTDPTDPQSSAAYFAWKNQLEQDAQAQASAGAAGRIQFESERALQQEQAQSLRFGRVRDKLDLAMATDQLADARRSLAVSALLEAAPRMVNPGQEFFPGMEPGGAGMELARLLGVGLEPQRMPTATLPLQELVDAPMAVPPEMIFSELGALQ